MSIFSYLMEVREKRGGVYLTLLDPDRINPDRLIDVALRCVSAGADAILVGSSLLISADFGKTIRDIKSNVDVPLIIHPSGVSQIFPGADAILFLVLISGRNPELLIGQHVKSAPILRNYGIEPISTGYMLVESGKMTSVEYMSNTKPIPRDKADIAMACALAAEYIGMKLIYIESGSGAKWSVPEDMISSVAAYCSLPIMVGGGIREPGVARDKIESGASLVVTGNIIEGDGGESLVREFAEAVHVKG